MISATKPRHLQIRTEYSTSVAEDTKWTLTCLFTIPYTISHLSKNPSCGPTIHNTLPFPFFPLKGCFSITSPQSVDNVTTVPIGSTSNTLHLYEDAIPAKTE